MAESGYLSASAQTPRTTRLLLRDQAQRERDPVVELELLAAAYGRLDREHVAADLVGKDRGAPGRAAEGDLDPHGAESPGRAREQPDVVADLGGQGEEGPGRELLGGPELGLEGPGLHGRRRRQCAMSTKRE